jgi:hypothetical protein
MNDDKSPLLDLISCLVCHQTMKLEKIDPDGEGDDLIQYRCKQCGSIERLRLFEAANDDGPVEMIARNAGNADGGRTASTWLVGRFVSNRDQSSRCSLIRSDSVEITH